MTQPMPPPAPPRASDPAVLTDGTVVPRGVPAAVGGGSFTVDLAHAPQAVHELESALRQLEDLRRDAHDLGRVVPPAPDPVSRDAAALLGAAAVGGTGSLVEALDAGADRLRALISKVRHELESYQEAENTSQALMVELRL